jgi:hypothetical protein
LAIGHSDPPPSLQALGEILFDNIDEDVVSVVGNTPRVSDAAYSGLAIVERSELSTLHMGIHRKSGRKSGSKIWQAKKIWNGWPANRSRFVTK